MPTKKTKSIYKVKPNTKQERLAYLVLRQESGDHHLKDKTKEDLKELAGYSRNNTTAFNSKGFNQAIIEAFEEVGLTDKLIAKELKNLLNNDNYNAKDKAITHYLKVKGSYAPTQHNIQEDISITHEIKADQGDYLDYIKHRNKQRKIIDGEIIEQ